MSFFDLFSTKKKGRSQQGISQEERLVAKAMIKAGEPLVEISHRRIDPDENAPTPQGAPISYLDAQALKYWDKKRTDFKIPDYYSSSAFGRNVGPALSRLLGGGYLQIGDIRKSIALKQVPELKEILLEYELKTSGRKAELVQRLMDNLSLPELEATFPVHVYEVTDKGMHAIEKYSLFFDNEHLGLGFPYYRLLKEQEENPDDSNEAIFLRLLSDDINRALKNGEHEQYRIGTQKLAQYLNTIGQPEDAIQCYCLSFFMFWYRNAFDLKVNNTFAYEYGAKRIDECGKICGYSFDQTLKVFRTSLHTRNPFNLCTKRNIATAEKVLKDALSI